MSENLASPTGKARQRALRVFFVFVALQLLVPLTYYLRDDPYDERFAWRMFSAIRLHQCQTAATEMRGGAQAAISLPRTIHNAWIRHLGRNRRDVVDAFLERRCDEEGVESVRVVNQCRGVAGDTYEPQVYERTCASGEVSMPNDLQPVTP